MAATKLQDRKLLAKLAAGDMHAIDAYHHVSCLTFLYNQARSIKSHTQEISESDQPSLEAIAVAELVMYIEETPRTIVFQLSDLNKCTLPQWCSLEQMSLKELTALAFLAFFEFLRKFLICVHTTKEGKANLLGLLSGLKFSGSNSRVHNF